MPTRKITASDLAPVKLALASSVPPDKAVGNLNPIQAALFAVTVLLAADHTDFAFRTYGPTVKELVVNPIAPPGGWPRGDAPPDWHRRQENIVDASHRMGLHTGTNIAGGKTTVHRVPELLALLEDPQLRRRARDWYACFILGQGPLNLGPRLPVADSSGVIERRLAMQDMVAGDNLLAIMTGLDERTLRAIRDRLDSVLNKFFPDE
ncbi:MAG TPA: hypothetical protein VGH44_05615 [Candidatus Saccharimonadia bacterium]